MTPKNTNSVKFNALILAAQLANTNALKTKHALFSDLMPGMIIVNFIDVITPDCLLKICLSFKK